MKIVNLFDHVPNPNPIQKQDDTLYPESIYEDVLDYLNDLRESDCNKGTFGTLACICGSCGMAGAAMLCGSAAMTCGSGIVKMILPDSIYPIAASNLWESVFVPMPQSKDGTLRYSDFEKILTEAEKCTAVVIGCGLKVTNDTEKIVCELLTRCTKPIILDADGIPICVKQDRLGELLEKLDCEGGQTKPGLVITDSQVFGEVAKTVPADIPLTSFSILMARYKGFLDSALAGVREIDELKDGDVILISEGCTHHRQCGDIGTEKIPAWIRKKTGADIRFETSSGTGFPDDLTKYALIIHCGACMLNDREVRWRMKCAADQGIPFTNYGTAIAYMRGILDRSTEIVRNE